MPTDTMRIPTVGKALQRVHTILTKPPSAVTTSKTLPHGNEMPCNAVGVGRPTSPKTTSRKVISHVSIKPAATISVARPTRRLHRYQGLARLGTRSSIQ